MSYPNCFEGELPLSHLVETSIVTHQVAPIPTLQAAATVSCADGGSRRHAVYSGGIFLCESLPALTPKAVLQNHSIGVTPP